MSDSVGGHTSYKSSRGFGQAYSDNFQSGVDRDGGDGDGGDGDSGDGGTGDTAPTINSLSLFQFTWWGNDIDVDWAVSDDDYVRLRVTDAAGNRTSQRVRL